MAKLTLSVDYGRGTWTHTLQYNVTVYDTYVELSFPRDALTVQDSNININNVTISAQIVTDENHDFPGRGDGLIFETDYDVFTWAGGDRCRFARESSDREVKLYLQSRHRHGLGSQSYATINIPASDSYVPASISGSCTRVISDKDGVAEEVNIDISYTRPSTSGGEDEEIFYMSANNNDFPRYIEYAPILKDVGGTVLAEGSDTENRSQIGRGEFHKEMTTSIYPREEFLYPDAAYVVSVPVKTVYDIREEYLFNTSGETVTTYIYYEGAITTYTEDIPVVAGYKRPSALVLSQERANADGVADPLGEYIAVEVSYDVSPTASQSAPSSLTVSVLGDEAVMSPSSASGSETLLLGPYEISVAESYDNAVVVTVADNFYSFTESYDIPAEDYDPPVVAIDVFRSTQTGRPDDLAGYVTAAVRYEVTPYPSNVGALRADISFNSDALEAADVQVTPSTPIEQPITPSGVITAIFGPVPPSLAGGDGDLFVDKAYEDLVSATITDAVSSTTVTGGIPVSGYTPPVVSVDSIERCDPTGAYSDDGNSALVAVSYRVYGTVERQLTFDHVDVDVYQANSSSVVKSVSRIGWDEFGSIGTVNILVTSCVPTEDTHPVEGKVYYAKRPITVSNPVSEWVIAAAENPAEAGLYEEERLLDTDKTYTLVCTLYDIFLSDSKMDTLSLAFFTMDFLRGGHGVGIGKPSSRNNVLDIGMDLYSDSLMHIAEELDLPHYNFQELPDDVPARPCLVSVGLAKQLWLYLSDGSRKMFYDSDAEGFHWPAGLIIPRVGGDIPDGYLPCDGAAVSRAVYDELFEAIGTTFGAGDGLSTFNVPQLLGAPVALEPNYNGTQYSDDYLIGVNEAAFIISTGGDFPAIKGADGNGIASIAQTVETDEALGVNVLTITLDSGLQTEFHVRNGAIGSSEGFCPWPVGSVLQLTNDTDPNDIYPNTEWTVIQGAFLLASSASHPLGQTGGAETVTLTAAQSGMPAHGHGNNLGVASTTLTGSVGGLIGWNGHMTQSGIMTYKQSGTPFPSAVDENNRFETISVNATHSHSLTGGVSNAAAANASQAHNNMPPFKVVNMWERTR